MKIGFHCHDESLFVGCRKPALNVEERTGRSAAIRLWLAAVWVSETARYFHQVPHWELSCGAALTATDLAAR